MSKECINPNMLNTDLYSLIGFKLNISKLKFALYTIQNSFLRMTTNTSLNLISIVNNKSY